MLSRGVRLNSSSVLPYARLRMAMVSPAIRMMSTTSRRVNPATTTTKGPPKPTLSSATAAASRETKAPPVPKFKFDVGTAGVSAPVSQQWQSSQQQQHRQQQQAGEEEWQKSRKIEAGEQSFVSKVFITAGAVVMVGLTTWQLFIRKKPYAEGKQKTTTGDAGSSGGGAAPAPAPATATVASAGAGSEAAVKKPEVTKTFEYYFGPAGSAALDNMLLFSGRVNQALATDIAKYLGVELGRTTVKTFADGEIGIQVNENIRGKDCFIVQSISKPVNDNLVELLLMISTMRRASAQSITAVIPYYGYARQDRKFTSRVPISAADVARMLSSLGVDRVIAVDLHSGQIQGFFPPRVPVTHMLSGFVGATFFAEKQLKSPVIVACDAGGVGRAKHFRDILARHGHEDASLDIAMLIQKGQKKDRAGHLVEGVTTQAKLDLVGTVTDSDCILIGDIIDSAATMVRAAEVLRQNGAQKIFAFAPHGLFNGEAVNKIMASPLSEVVVTDTCQLSPQAAAAPKIRQLSLAPLLAEAITRVHRNESVSTLFSSPKMGQEPKPVRNAGGTGTAPAAVEPAAVTTVANVSASTAAAATKEEATDDLDGEGDG